MKAIYRQLLKEQIKLHEGVRLKPYEDSVGKLTIGVGRNLDDMGISEHEADYLLESDIDRVRNELLTIDWYNDLNDSRKNVIIEMAFNMGLSRLLKFRKMIDAIKHKRWELAAKEMLNSKWHVQVGKRSDTMAEEMETGIYNINT